MTVGVFLLLGLEVRVLITHTVFVDCFFSKIATQFLFLFFSGFFVVADVVVCLGFLSITGIVPVMQLALINRAGGLYDLARLIRCLLYGKEENFYSFNVTGLY